jgi:hypothetical protein
MAEVASVDFSNFDTRIIQIDISAAGDVSMYLDGVSLALSTGSSITQRLLDGDGAYGANYATIAQDVVNSFFEGNVAEVLVYGQKLSDDDRDRLVEFLQDKWGI